MAAPFDRENIDVRELGLAALLDLVQNVAKGIGDALNRDSTQTTIYRRLKISLATLWAERGSSTLILIVERSLHVQNCLRELAAILEEAISRQNVEGAFHALREVEKVKQIEEETRQSSVAYRIRAYVPYFGNEPGLERYPPRDWSHTPYPRLHMFEELLQRSPLVQTWQSHHILSDRDMRPSQLAGHIQNWNNMVDRASMGDTNLSEPENLDSFYPEPPIRQVASVEVDYVRSLANNIHDILHGNWPCDVQGHDHSGKLGDCSEARFFLDPQWLFKNEGLSNEGLVILNGLEITQECHICPFPKDIIMMQNYNSACLVLHEYSQTFGLNLLVDDKNRLWCQKSSAISPKILNPGQEHATKSLTQLLKAVRPTRTARRVLGIIMARAILCLIEGPWLSQFFSIDDVSIHCQIEADRVDLHFDKLFVSTSFKKNHAQHNSDENRFSIHPFPTILSLGISLAEIEIGEEISPAERRKVHSLTTDLLRKCEQLSGQNEGIFRAISACFNPAFFSDLRERLYKKYGGKVDSNTVYSDKDFIDAYYQKIVRPLEEDLHFGAKWTWEDINSLKNKRLEDGGIFKIISEAKRSDHTNQMIRLEQTQGTKPVIRSTSNLIMEQNSYVEMSPPPIERRPLYFTGDSSEERTNMFNLSRSSTLWSAPNPEHYNVGIVCALPKELLAVRALFESKHEDLELPPQDTNRYALGTMGKHSVVAACLPSGEYGTNSAAAVITHMTRSFPEVETFLFVGVGGGVPSKWNDIRLGDVVVSLPSEEYSGVIQYDLGRALKDGVFQRTGALQRPPRNILAALSNLRSDPDLPREPLQDYLQDIEACNAEYGNPKKEDDRLFAPDYPHELDASSCEKCNGPEVARVKRSSEHPKFHYGLIASGNQVMQDTKLRDEYAAKYNILCFEMEAAGVMNSVPTLVIRGICDYSDSHKNYLWQEYASATAAAYTRLLLRYVRR